SITGSTPARPVPHCPPISSPVGAFIPVIVARSAATAPPRNHAVASQSARQARHYQRPSHTPSGSRPTALVAWMPHVDRQLAVAAHFAWRPRRLVDDETVDGHRVLGQSDRREAKIQPADNLKADAVEEAADVRDGEPARLVRT